MKEICAYCGRDCDNENPFAWDSRAPFCSEACFEAWRDEGGQE